MAAIDKCYVSSYKDYLDFKNWAKGKTFTTPRGVKVTISNWIHPWDEKDFDDTERLIFNTPTYVDNYLYHNCPLEFIQEWLFDRYPEEPTWCKGLREDITKELSLPEYEPCTKVKCIRKNRWRNHTPFSLYNGYTNKKIRLWYIDVLTEDNDSLWVNDEKGYFLMPGEIDAWTCSIMVVRNKSIETIIRKIIKT